MAALIAVATTLTALPATASALPTSFTFGQYPLAQEACTSPNMTRYPASYWDSAKAGQSLPEGHAWRTQHGTTSGSGYWCYNYEWNGNSAATSMGIRNCTDGASFWSITYLGINPFTLGGGGSGWHGHQWDERLTGKTNVTVKTSSSNDIEPGDIVNRERALDADGEPYGYGHVGFVTTVTRNEDGNITSIKVAEMNKGQDGAESHLEYYRSATGSFPTWDNFIDINGAGKGLGNSDDVSGGTGTGGTVSGVTWNGVNTNNGHKGDRLERGESLYHNQYIAPDNLRSVLYMQSDGNLILAVEGNVVWESGTSGKGVDRAVFQDDGNLVLYKGTENIWDPRNLPANQQQAGMTSYQAATSTATLIIQNDGNVVAYNDAAKSSHWWSTATAGQVSPTTNIGNANMHAGDEIRAGEYIHNLDGLDPHALTFQHDGNLVLYGPGRHVEWDSDTNGSGAVRAVIQHDGNFTIRKADNGVVAHTQTYGNSGGGVYLRLGGDGNLVVYKPAPGPDTPLWDRNKKSMSIIPW